MIGRLLGKLRSSGVRGLARAAYRRVVPRRFRHLAPVAACCRDAVGLEIGGPSAIFGRRGAVPVYPLARRIDNCNFGNETVWEGTIEEGLTFRFDRRKAPGRQFIAEAVHLPAMADGSYDFVLSSHCLEHLANPLRGLQEWLRVLRPGGLLVLVVPHRDGTFDHARPLTGLEHLLADYARGTNEDDQTHIDEVLELTDLSVAPGVTDKSAFEARTRRNAENRCVHHHVFDTRLVLRMLDAATVELLAMEPMPPCHIVVAARKPEPGSAVSNERFLADAVIALRASPFPTDAAGR